MTTYYVVDDNGEAAAWYRNGPLAGRAAGHATMASAERERRRVESEVGEADITTVEPPVPYYAG
jgi:hypothetical protein